MKTLRVNPLPVIQCWLDYFGLTYMVSSKMSRAMIIEWLNNLSRPLWAEHAELLADCLIAAGIGRAEEQTRTVYCTASYE